MNDQHVSFLDYVYIWLKWRRLIIWMVGVTTILAVGVSLIMPKYYLASTSILPPKQETPFGGASPMASLTAGLSFFGLGQTEELDKYLAILQSRQVRENVIKKFNLQDYYKKETMDEVLKALDSDVDIEITKENTVELSMIHRDSVLVAEITNYFIVELDQINKSLSNDQARNNRIFIEGRLSQTRQALQHAENTLRTYQEEHKTLGISEESRAALLAGAELEAEVMALEVQRDVLRRSLGASHPLLSQIGSQIEASQRRLVDLPQMGLELARLLREVEIQIQLLTFLLPQYEQAKFQEAKDTPTVQIIDRAVPPQLKYSPKRMFIVLGASLSSFLISLMLSLSLESVQRARENKTRQGERIEQIIVELRSFFFLKRK